MLSEQDMMDIAAYYSIQTISENSAKADAETLELGRKIYVGGKMDTQDYSLYCLSWTLKV